MVNLYKNKKTIHFRNPENNIYNLKWNVMKTLEHNVYSM